MFWGMKGGLTLPSSMAGGKPQGQALRVLVYSQPCPFPPATLHLQVAKAERRSASGGAQTERLTFLMESGESSRLPYGFLLNGQAIIRC